MTSKKLIAFDLDDTLAVTKSAISERMATLLRGLLDHYDVCVISGGKFEQFEKQVVANLHASDKQLANLHLMPTCGTRYHRYENGAWKLKYAEDLSDEQKAEIIRVLEEEAKKLGLWPSKPWGDVIEDRGSQVTFSALGQQAPAEAKYKWADENEIQKQVLRTAIANNLPGLEVRLGGTTSVDITRVGIDKAYGINKLVDELSISYDDILFIGDKLQEGGNDYPVKALGVDSIEVGRWEDTAYVLEGILAVQ